MIAGSFSVDCDQDGTIDTYTTISAASRLIATRSPLPVLSTSSTPTSKQEPTAAVQSSTQSSKTGSSLTGFSTPVSTEPSSFSTTTFPFPQTLSLLSIESRSASSFPPSSTPSSSSSQVIINNSNSGGLDKNKTLEIVVPIVAVVVIVLLFLVAQKLHSRVDGQTVNHNDEHLRQRSLSMAEPSPDVERNTQAPIPSPINSSASIPSYSQASLFS